MIAKGKAVSHGRNVVNYVLRENKLKVFEARNLISGQTAGEILREMNLTQLYNNRCKNKFLRFEIGIAPGDIEKLQKNDLSKIAKTFAQKMNLQNHQWFAVSHKDTKNLHIHLVANRIGIDGKVYQTDFVSNRSARIAEEISREMGLTVANEVKAKKRYQKPHTDKDRETKKADVQKIAYTALGRKQGNDQEGFFAFIRSLDKQGVTIEIMRNKQDKAYGFRFHYEGETFKASEIGREFGYRSLFNQFGLSDLKPQTGQTVVPIYEPPQEQDFDLDLSAADTAINIAGELSSAVGSVFTAHGEDYRETAFPPKFEFFDDRFEITSYGSLPEGLSEEDFFAGVSMPRNKEIMRIFKDLELVEHLGSGVPRILQSYGRENFHFLDNFIRMSFPIVEQVGTKLKPGQNQAGTESGLSWDQVGTKLGLSPQEVQNIVKFCADPRSLTEIMELFNWSNRTKFRNKYINPLLEIGLLEMTVPDKPNSSLQKYKSSERWDYNK